MNQPLVQAFAYNKWANSTLLEACRELSGSQLAARPPGVSGSVGELLTHLVGSQQTFVLRTRSRQNEGELTRESPWPGIDALIEIAGATSDELIAIAGTLTEDREADLAYMGKTYRFPVSFFLTHALEHGVEHRTEIKVALSQLGVATPDLDGWAYATAMGCGRVV
jgi:uncharacterized damage-inducible protein DinB